MEQLKNGKFRAKIYINGKAVTRTFTRKTDADKWKRQKLIEKEQFMAFGVSEPREMTLAEFIDHWFKQNLNRAPRTLDAYHSVCRQYLIPLFGKFNLKTIRITHGQELISSLTKKELSIARINFVLRFFRQLLHDAIRWEFLLSHPFKNLKNLKERKTAEVYWTTEEIQQFLQMNRNHSFYNMFVVALNTGMRRGELLGLQWDKVDLKNRMIQVTRIRDRYGLKETTKTGEVRCVPINDSCFKALLNQKDKKIVSDYVFTNCDGTLPHLEHISDRLFMFYLTHR